MTGWLGWSSCILRLAETHPELESELPPAIAERIR